MQCRPWSLCLLVAGLAACGEDPAATPTGVPKLYVANEEGGSISVLDPATRRELARIDLGEITPAGNPRRYQPRSVQVAPDGRSVWVTAPIIFDEGRAHDHSGNGEQAIVIDPQTDRVVARVGLGFHTRLQNVVLDADSRYAYVTGTEANQIYRIDARARTLVDRYDLGPGTEPMGARICAGKLFVATPRNNNLAVFDLATGDARDIPLGAAAAHVACTRDGRYAFATLYEARAVVRVEVATAAITRIELPGATGPTQLYPSPDGRRVYVCDQGMLLGRNASDKLFEIDAAAGTVTGTVTVGRGPQGVVLRQDGALAWVTNTADGTVSEVDTAARRVVATMPAGTAPAGVGYWFVTGGMP